MFIFIYALTKLSSPNRTENRFYVYLAPMGRLIDYHANSKLLLREACKSLVVLSNSLIKLVFGIED